MAGDWIKIEHVTPDKPEVFMMSEELNIDPDTVIGKLLRFWIWADQQSLDGSLSRLNDNMIDRVTHQKGFGVAMRMAGWLSADGIPNFNRHNGNTAKERAHSNRRMAKSRSTFDMSDGNVTPEAQQNRNSGDGNVTPEAQQIRNKIAQKAQPEKRREEKRREEHRNNTGGGNSTASWPVDNFPPPSVSTQACVAMTNAGIMRVNPSHPLLISLCKAGATPLEFADAATDAIDRGKPDFAYVLGTVNGRRNESAANTKNPSGAIKKFKENKSADRQNAFIVLTGKNPNASDAPATIEGVAERVD